jgi:hypothetical protein
LLVDAHPIATNDRRSTAAHGRAQDTDGARARLRGVGVVPFGDRDLWRSDLWCSAAKIVGLVVSEGLMLVGTGLILGIAGAVALRKALENQLYGVQPPDPVVMLMVMAALGLVALAACLFPARRATLVDPMTVLNEQ